MSRRFAGLTPYEGYEDMNIEKKDGVVVVTLNRPERLNALSPAMRAGVMRLSSLPALGASAGRGTPRRGVRRVSVRGAAARARRAARRRR